MYNESTETKSNGQKTLETSTKITLIAGPMCAGKSAELIEMITRLERANRKYICFRPESSKRKNDDTAHITSRSKELSVKADFLKNEFDANKMTKTIDNYDVFIFDEIHFLDLNSIKNFVQKCIETHKKKEIIFAGLDMDFQGEKFEQFEYISTIAQEKILLTADCSVKDCENEATHSAKIGGNHKQKLEAGAGMYKACCYPHWKFLNRLLNVKVADDQILEEKYLSESEKLENMYKASDSVVMKFQKNAKTKEVEAKLEFNKNDHTCVQIE